ncbi:MAG: DUF4397 domain-containing protein [Thermomicrobiales bacterium]
MIDEVPAAMRTISQSRRGLLRVAGAGAVVALAGTRGFAVTRAQTPFPTRIKVLNAAPSLGKVEVLFNGKKELDEFTYGMTSDWIDVSPGLVRATVRRDRAGFNYIVFDAIAPVVANEDYILILSDPLVIPVPVDKSPLAADQARVRVVHATVDVPAVDIAVKGGNVIVDNLQYAQLSAPVDVPAGTYDLEVRLHGTSEVALDIPDVTVEPGVVYDVVAYGTPGDERAPLTVQVITSEARAGAPAATPTS